MDDRKTTKVPPQGGQRKYFANDTWVDLVDDGLPLPETKRRARVVCPDGKIRIARVGNRSKIIAGKMEIVLLGRVKVRGHTVAGFVREFDAMLSFIPFGKNASLFSNPPFANSPDGVI